SSVSAPVDVTGWRVRTDRGAEIVINGGVNYAGPVNLARILLRPGVAATIYESRGTFVKNVEMNKCTGYLNDTYDFTPDLPNNCPRPDRNDVAGLSSSCQSFVLSLGACRKPTGDEWNRFANEGDLNCLVFLSNLNYENCYREHSAEADFFRYGWRVWLDQAFPFDREGGKLFLLDSAGLLVDVYTY
ncbi:MAG TPA: hypothetical protein VNK70_00735, partial [Candidatus Paceibacterota bacterium]|nr:hypothetical protein [Candidatus Paceibacterota bacterium]